MPIMKRFLVILFAVALFLSYGCGGGSGPVWPPDGDGDGRVPGYTLLYPDKTCRWDTESFPILVWIDSPPASAGGYGPSMVQAAIEGLEMWNGAIDGVPVTFQLEQVEENTDIRIRWEAMNLGGYTLATEFPDRIRIRKAALNETLRDPAMIRLLMAHELGHVLGLDLSNTHGDLMFATVDPVTTSFTDRDSKMINWLYGQENYFPIRSE